MERSLSRIRHGKIESKYATIEIKIVPAKSDSKIYINGLNSARKNNRFAVLLHLAHLCVRLNLNCNRIQRLVAENRENLFSRFILAVWQHGLAKPAGRISLHQYVQPGHRNIICEPKENELI